MNAHTLYHGIVSLGLDPNNVSHLSHSVYVRVTGDIPHANEPHPVSIAQEITIYSHDDGPLMINTSHSGFSGQVDAEQAHALADLATRYATVLQRVEDYVAGVNEAAA